MVRSKKVGKYTYYKSTSKGKKLMVKVNGKTIHFGAMNYQHYKDKTGFYKSKDHLDKDRRRRYLARASNIKNKFGKLTKSDPNSANYHAIRILW